MNQEKEQITVEVLMRPRYKVIAMYPQSGFKVGDIWPNVAPDWTTEEQKEFTLSEMAQYPHLFKRLEWWEDRKPEEMPEYVKAESGIIYKAEWVKGAVTENGKQLMRMKLNEIKNDWQVIPSVMCFYEPATLHEYQSKQK